jgi:hypothetical protein
VKHLKYSCALWTFAAGRAIPLRHNSDRELPFR